MRIETIKDIIMTGDSYATSDIMFTALDVGIFDTISEDGSSVEDLATNLDLNKNALGRYMNWLCDLRLVEKEGIFYHNAPITKRYLVRSSEGNYVDWLYSTKYFKEALWPKLGEALKSGTDQYGRDNEEMWDKFFSDEEELRDIIGCFDAPAQNVGRDIADGYKFKQGSIVTDVGGGSGGLVARIKEKRLDLNCGVADRQVTIDVAKKNFNYPINHFAVDFFRDDLPKSDYMILSWIIHDWDEASISKILSNCHKNLNEGGKIMLVELLPEKNNSFGYWNVMDGHMLLSTQGRERTLSEYKELMNNFGFEYAETFSLKNDPRKVMVYEKK